MRIRDGDSLDPGSGMEKSRIRIHGTLVTIDVFADSLKKSCAFLFKVSVRTYLHFVCLSEIVNSGPKK